MKEMKLMATSWSRSFLAAVLAVLATGETDPKNIVMAGVAAVVPVIIRWLNPQDVAFGIKDPFKK